MADDTDPWVAVATVIPKSLHREAKGYCRARAMTLMEFVAEALVEKLRTSRPPDARRAAPHGLPKRR